MQNFFDKSLHFLGKNYDQVFVINIGAMDGVLFDEMIRYTRTYKFKGLYVEPIPYLYEKLKNNIQDDGNFFENSAISTYDGEIEMMTIDQSVIDSGLIHNCFYGMSSVYPPKNGLGSEFDRPTVEKYGQIIKVPSITFDTLCQKHNLSKFNVLKIDAEGHDFQIFKQIDLNKYTPEVIRIEWINLTEFEQKEIIKKLQSHDYVYELSGQDIIGLKLETHNKIFGENINLKKEDNTPKQQNIVNPNNDVTFVTGLWDIGRNNLKQGWNRSYEHYLEKLDQLLKIENNLIIFGDENLKDFVLERRTSENTQFVLRDLSWFKNNSYFDIIQSIRTNSDWFNQSGWLKDSTQSQLEYYNPLVMSKMFLLHDAKILDKFDSKFLFWIDGGITNTIHPGYFTHDKVQNKLKNIFNKFSFICFPYKANTEIHGFSYPKINDYADSDVCLVGRGGFFGGPKDSISDMNTIYYNLLMRTLQDGYMGTEESLFSIMIYKHSDIINYFEIEENGLLSKFFEDLKNDRCEVKNFKNKNVKNSNLDISKVGLYVITFNSPKQFETLIQSMSEYDSNFLHKTEKFLLDNSTDSSTFNEYSELCDKHGFTHIKKDNLGICGGRQWIAEHFDKETGLDYYLFFEDDMFFYPNKGTVCRNGFNRYVENFYSSSLEIIYKENFDFLKLNYSEFFGDNGTQWSWYNVPQTVREEFWPEKSNLPKQGLDPNAPKTVYKNVISHKGIPYTNGEVYYSNWPQIVSRDGNKKMFLDTTWARPFEQTWMSHMFQLVKKGELNPGLLLMTPTEHNRFEHYDRELRKES